MIIPKEYEGMEDPAKDLSDDEIYAKMEERSATQDLIGFGQVVNPWAKPGIQTYTGTVIVGGIAIFLIITLIHGIYYKWYLHNDWKEGIAATLILIAGIMALYVYGSTYYGFYTQSYDIYMGRQWLMAKGMYGQMKRIRYEDIDKVIAMEPFKMLMKSKLVIKSRVDPEFEIRINSVLIRFGEVIEHILEHAVNVTEVNVDEFAKDIMRDEVYKKEPNWEIINRAKMRAEENRKK